MRLIGDTLLRFCPLGIRNKGHHSLVWQRVFWGAVAGCLASIFLFESPLLETLELEMLRWRYRVSTQIARCWHQPEQYKELVIVAFDDSSQFDLGIARFNDERSQGIMAQALSVVEKGQPALVAIDLDLRGAANPGLIKLFSRYRNVVLTLFGSLEGSTDLPAAEFMTHAAAYGYSELSKEVGGLVCRLPLNCPGKGVQSEDRGFQPVPSLTEAIVDVHRRVKGVGPGLQSLHPEQLLYISFKRFEYPTVSFQKVLKAGFSPDVFAGKVVLIGSTMTSRHDDPLRCRTPLGDLVPEVEVQAEAVSTLLANQAIYSFSKGVATYLLIVFGAVLGAICSNMPMSLRAVVVLSAAALWLVVAQGSFDLGHAAIPVVPPLAILSAVFVLGTVIYLDTDLRQRNRELAEARESMQVRAEEERQRIAEDLHDETLPALSTVARMADRLSQELGEHPVPRQMRDKLDGAISEMRRVINDLHPSVLETMGFVPALENLVNILSRETGIESKFCDGTGTGDYNIGGFAELQLYRIVQEALNNVQKHSAASKVEVCVTCQDGNLCISVQDNGKGMDVKAVKLDSHGLLNIRQRAQLIGCQAEWGQPNLFLSGTQVSLKIPLAKG